MTYYEELGLTESASPEDIRRAHRTLTRLLHPDQQTEETLRQAAGLQMRRVNAIVDLLLDPQQRRMYDEGLRASHRETAPEAGAAIRVKRAAPFTVSHLFAIVSAAVIITLLTIWLLGGDLIHWNWTAPVPETVEAGSSRAPASVRPASAPAAGRTEARPQPGRADEPARPVEVPHIRKPLERKTFTPPAPAASRTSNLPGPDYLAYSPPAVAVPSPGITRTEPNPESPAGSEAFTGLWLLPSRGTSRSGAVREAPQYVQISIHRGLNDTIYGEYSARYEAPNRPVSPEVAFTFQGPVTGHAADLNWDASDGSRGAIELKLLTPESMEAAWRVTGFGSRIAFAGGAAVLIRRASEPR